MDPIEQTPSPDTAPAAQPPATPPADAAPADVPRTVEEVEAAWRNRLAQNGRAHKAAEEALREQIETLQRRVAAGVGQPAQPSEDGVDPKVVQDLQAELERERGMRVVEQRKAKYPALVESGIADVFFAAGDDANLAQLNALLDQGLGGVFIAPTAPKRQAAVAPRSAAEKTREELLDDLKRLEPAYQTYLRDEQQR